MNSVQLNVRSHLNMPIFYTVCSTFVDFDVRTLHYSKGKVSRDGQTYCNVYTGLALVRTKLPGMCVGINRGTLNTPLTSIHA